MSTVSAPPRVPLRDLVAGLRALPPSAFEPTDPIRALLAEIHVENFHLEFQDLATGKSCLTASNTVELSPAHPCAVDPNDPVHRVVNPREANERAVTLQVYSRPFDTCVVYSPEQETCGDMRLHYNTVFGKPVASA